MCIHKNSHTRTRIPALTHIYTHTHTYTHSYTHTHTHTHTHTGEALPGDMWWESAGSGFKLHQSVTAREEVGVICVV
jgi:hypothetical protein